MMDKAKVKKISVYSLATIGLIAILAGIYFFLQRTVNPNPLGNYVYEKSYESKGPVSRPSQATMEAVTMEGRDVVENSVNQNYGASQLEQRKVTKNGELRLLVEDAETTAKKIINKTLELGGFVQNTNIREVKEGIKSGTIVVKVPADKFTEAFSAFKGYGIKVEKETANSQDVTERYIDLEAQLKNLRAEEKQYLEVMNRAYTVEDILKVSQYLSRVRGQIDRLEGQLKYLDRQVEMSTITTHLTAEAEVEVFGIRWRPLYEIKKSFRNLLEGLKVYTNAVISFVFYLPVLLLWIVSIAIIIWLVVKIIKWILKKKRPKNDNPPFNN